MPRRNHNAETSVSHKYTRQTSALATTTRQKGRANLLRSGRSTYSVARKNRISDRYSVDYAVRHALTGAQLIDIRDNGGLYPHI
jgi:hypothetical protein